MPPRRKLPNRVTTIWLAGSLPAKGDGGHDVCAAIWGDISAVCCGRASRRNRRFHRASLVDTSADARKPRHEPDGRAYADGAPKRGRLNPKQTAALSAPFILANSVVGFAGTIYAGETPAADTWLFALAAPGGALLGTIVGLRWMSQTMTRCGLAAILAAAGVQLLLFKRAIRFLI
jgi:hypothetical protein